MKEALVRTMVAILFSLAGLWMTGCQATTAAREPNVGRLAMSGIVAGDAGAGSLFPGDQAVLTNGQIELILGSKVYPPANGRIAVVRLGQRDPFWWISEELAALDQQTTDGLMTKLRSSPRVADALLLPSLLVPQQMTIPYLREAAARVQADSLLVYRTFTQTYETTGWFSPDRTKAHCTVEALLLDTRTGIVTTTAVATQNFALSQSSHDANFSETIARAEEKATAQALARVGDDLLHFLNTAPISPPATRPASAVRTTQYGDPAGR